MPKDSLLTNRIKSVGYALKGAWLLLRTESSIQIQLGIAVIMTVAGFIFELSTLEWVIQIMAISLVLGIEGLNTAVEKLSDFVHPDFNDKIGFIKDISAGAVMFVSIGASIIGLLIYLPKII
ncbi:diacylglycerol kinase family protein [Eudoraea chungangensis]|uniref:diacylglycerol kinase family protein n=1 Tax=Eudoraea chungangensis TaxID=1481905 RepID=UPI0023EAE8F2|nr:diacylglycerol kinase family protein [Eudoraea chungangensis]